MKKVFLFGLIISVLMLTACSMNDGNGVEKFKKTIQDELVDKKFHHVEETITQTMNGVTVLEQKKQLYYHDGDFYVENVQGDNMFIYGIKFYSNGYIAQTGSADEIKWAEVQNLQTLDALKSWFLTLEKDSFAFKEEYITIEENAEGITVIYDRSQEVTPTENELNTVKETYYFDKRWNLVKAEIIAEGMMTFGDGLSGNMQYITTTKFMDTSKKDIFNKIKDVYDKIK